MAVYTDKVVGSLPRQIVAGTGSTTYVGRVAFAGIVSAISLLPATALTGDPTNNRVFTAKNGATTLATLTTTASQVAGTAVAMVLTATAADLVVAANAPISIVETVGGTGVVHGSYLAEVSVARTDQP